MRILAIEDDKELAGFLKQSLEAACFAVDIAEDGEHGGFLAKTNDYDLVLLDYNLPKKNGPQVCKEIRAAGKTMPILILSVESEIPKKVELFDMGADDYITKPFSLEELLARIRAVLRRPPVIKNEILRIDDLMLDTRKQTVERGKKNIYLTKKEFMLLEYLLKNKDNVVSRGEIMEHVWDIHGDIFSNTIETHILTLRRKIDRAFKNKLIHTVPGRGYKISLKK